MENGSSNSLGRIVYISSVSSLVTVMVCIALFAFFWSPLFAGIQNAEPQFVESIHTNESVPQRTTERIITLYQTLISTLIGVNALIAALSIFYIKSSSEDKAKEMIQKEAGRYFATSEFVSNLENKVASETENRLKTLKSEFESELTKLYQMTDEIEKLSTEHSELKHSSREIRRQIIIVSDAISQLDKKEMEGNDLNISGEGEV